MTSLQFSRPETGALAASAASAALLALPASCGVAFLLPGRALVLEHLAEVLPGSDTRPTTLVVIGMLRRDDHWPTPAGVLDVATSVLAAAIRGDDWLGLSGPSEFAAVLGATAADAEIAAARVLANIAAADIPGFSACAGIAVLDPSASPTEVLRRATLSLTVARSVGPRQVIRYTGSR